MEIPLDLHAYRDPDRRSLLRSLNALKVELAVQTDLAFNSTTTKKGRRKEETMRIPVLNSYWLNG